MNSRTQLIVGIALILTAAFSRLIPHPMNFAPITAIALFGGMYFDKRFAPVLPLAALMVSDYFLGGLYEGIVWVYGSFLVIALLGMFASTKRSVPVIAASTFAGSILFFLITNFGVWMTGTLYPQTLEGLTACYIAALPFFRNAVAGDIFYVTVLFGVYELVKRAFPAATAARQ